MKAKIITTLFQNGWSWMIDLKAVSIEPYKAYSTQRKAEIAAIRWCKRFNLEEGK